MTDSDLYLRGIGTAVAGWARFARSVPGAEVHRLRHADVAVFPDGPESIFYNNAVVGRGLTPEQQELTLAALEHLYAAAGVADYAVWVHENDDDMREGLETRGYQIATSTRAMGMERAEFRDVQTEFRLVPSDWSEHKRILGVDPELLRLLDVTGVGVLVAEAGGEQVATGLSFDHQGDCGIYNVGTLEWARRRGFRSAVTLLALHEARDRGCTTASLQATPMAERLYAKLGFRDLGRYLEYVPGTA